MKLQSNPLDMKKKNTTEQNEAKNENIIYLSTELNNTQYNIKKYHLNDFCVS